MFDGLSSNEKEDYMLTKEKERIYQRSIEYAAKTGREEGRAEGHETGLAEGLATASLKTIAIAKAMLAEGLSVDTVIKCTGLSEEELSKI